MKKNIQTFLFLTFVFLMYLYIFQQQMRQTCGASSFLSTVHPSLRLNGLFIIFFSLPSLSFTSPFRLLSVSALTPPIYSYLFNHSVRLLILFPHLLSFPFRIPLCASSLPSLAGRRVKAQVGEGERSQARAREKEERRNGVGFQRKLLREENLVEGGKCLDNKHRKNAFIRFRRERGVEGDKLRGRQGDFKKWVREGEGRERGRRSRRERERDEI